MDSIYASSSKLERRIDTAIENRGQNVPFLSGSHGKGYRSIKMVVPSHGAEGEGGRGGGGHVQSGGSGIAGGAGGRRGGTLRRKDSQQWCIVN